MVIKYESLQDNEETAKENTVYYFNITKEYETRGFKNKKLPKVIKDSSYDSRIRQVFPNGK